MFKLKFIKENLDSNIFLLFLTLEKDSSHMKYDNVATIKIPNIDTISDEELYQKLLKGYVKWLEK